MADGVTIHGGADEFEAAVIAVVIEQVEREEKAARRRQPGQSAHLPAWVRAVRPEEPELSLDVLHPAP